MKKILFSIIAVLALTTSVFAQDARNRTVNTIVSDVLAQLPAQKADALEAQMADIVKAAPESIEIIASLFQPVEKGVNNKFEYAISGAVRYANTPGNEKYKAAVVKGLQNAIAKTSDSVAKAFFQNELYLLGNFEPKPVETPSVTELLAQAKTLAKSTKTNERCQSIDLFDQALGAANAPKVIAAMKDGNRAYRAAALRTAKKYADDAFFKKLVKAFGGASTEAKDDILYFLGDNGAASQIDFIIKQFAGKNAIEAIAAAGKIGGTKAADALIGQIGGVNNDAALSALEQFNGDIKDNVLAALQNASGDKLNTLVNLASKRHVAKAADQIIGLAKDGDANALQALAGVVTKKDTKTIAGLLDAATGAKADAYTKALVASVSAFDADGKFNALTDAMLGAKDQSKFFDAIAATASDKAVDFLAGATTAGSDKAVKALSKVNNAGAAKYMLAAADKDEDYLGRYIELTNTYETNIDSKAFKLIDALAAAKSTAMKQKIINNLSSAPTTEAFKAVAPYLDDKNTAYEAANAVKNIAPKIGNYIDFADLESAANKSIAILGATGNADDGYAVDALKKVISDFKPYPVTELTAEEKEAGFISLYNGTDLDQWIGDKKAYKTMNGVITVGAEYGGTGNFYTKDEYRNFIYRFEFRFLVPAANNGVGLRGPATGVDAAYDAMCEVQILDHDDPCYAHLQPYQVHGSVYGVIPAKRIVHKPIGEWETEEIKVVGDHITVTVNGEVIVDGNIREACQGHNVDPDGSGTNPYTRDHRNHPGMFNETGHISFCGHGRGLQFRNIRILPLPDDRK